MRNEKTNVGDTCSATVDRSAQHDESMSLHGTYRIVCHDRFGDIKWADVIDNLVATVGKNFTMDTVLGNVAGGAVIKVLTNSSH